MLLVHIGEMASSCTNTPRRFMHMHALKASLTSACFSLKRSTYGSKRRRALLGLPYSLKKLRFALRCFTVYFHHLLRPPPRELTFRIFQLVVLPRDQIQSIHFILLSVVES